MGRPTRYIDTDIEKFFSTPGFKVLDLCCCSGLGAEGMLRIPGVQVMGVDIVKPSYYPGTFLHANVLDLDLTFIKLFNFVTASPPCQKHSRGTAYAQQQGKEYPDIIPQVRKMLQEAEVPAAMENIPESGIRPDFMLCGTMFNLPQTRHRHFECINWKPNYTRLYCNHSTYKGNHHCITGSFTGTIHDAAISMDCYPTRLRSEIKEGYPPAYAKFVLQTFLSINNYSGISQLPGFLTSTQGFNNTPVI